MALDFIEETKGDLKNYVDDGSWPVTVDNFVEYYKNKHGIQQWLITPNDGNFNSFLDCLARYLTFNTVNYDFISSYFTCYL